MSQEFVQQGLSNAGAMARQMVSSGAQMAELGLRRQDAMRSAEEEAEAEKQAKIAYLTELLAEQEALVAAADESNDPEQERRIPEVMKNMMRIRDVLSSNPTSATLSGILERNKDRAQLEAETAAKRGGLRQPNQAKGQSPEVKTGGTDSKKKDDGKKDDGKRTVATARPTISLD